MYFILLDIVIDFRFQMSYYAVARGHKPGIYATWDECSEQVLGFSRSRYKKFSTEQEANEFIRQFSSSEVVEVAKKGKKRLFLDESLENSNVRKGADDR